MDVVTTLETTARILAVLAIIQSIEFLLLSRVTDDQGVWRWKDVGSELAGGSDVFEKLLGFFLAATPFKILNILRVIISVSVLFEPSALGLVFLFFFHLLTLLRWFGTFNGGSDAMNLLLLWTTGLGLFFPETLGAVCLWYISFQLCFSYFRAGLVKVRNLKWRSGQALGEFLNSPHYERTRISLCLARPGMARRLASWLIMIFEITYPIAVLNSSLAVSYIALGLIFHLLNVYFFGLNRFFFAWLGAYPALYYCSLR